MKSAIFRLCVALFAILLVCGFGLWRFSISSERTLESAKRQYDATREKIARYEAARGASSGADGGSLFSQANRIAASAGIGGRLENLRPASDKSGEILDLRARSLYLGEAMRFLSLAEGLDKAIIERMTLRRDSNNLLDLEMRIRRRDDG